MTARFVLAGALITLIVGSATGCAGGTPGAQSTEDSERAAIEAMCLDITGLIVDFSDESKPLMEYFNTVGGMPRDSGLLWVSKIEQLRDEIGKETAPTALVEVRSQLFSTTADMASAVWPLIPPDPNSRIRDLTGQDYRPQAVAAIDAWVTANFAFTDTCRDLLKEE